MTATVELRFTPNPEHVRTARLIAVAVGRRSGIPEVLIDEVRLATSEACARAVAVHRRKAPEELVLVRFVDGDDHFAIDVVDCGPPGDATRPSVDGEPGNLAAGGVLIEQDTDDLFELDLAGGPPAGLGLAILDGLVDDLEIRPREDAVGTVVAMRWWLPDPGPSVD